MKIETVTCDGCGRDITTRTNITDYRLFLGSTTKPGSGPGFYTAMHIEPPTKRDHHFCGLTCLDLWTDRRRYKDELWRAWWKIYEEEKGTPIPSITGSAGTAVSYPSPPDDLLNNTRAEYDKLALEKYPMKNAEPR